MSYQPYQPTRNANPYQDFEDASRDFWAGQRGSEHPPPPSYRMVKGKMRLGRYMDPYGCQAHMRAAQDRWQKWYTGFFIGVGAAALFGSVDFIFVFVALPVLGAWYLAKRAWARRQYDLYFRVMDEIVATGRVQWVPYDKTRLKLLDTEPLAVWP